MAKEILNKLRAPNNKRVSCQNGYGYNCNHITLFWKQKRNSFTNEEDRKKDRTLVRVKWDFSQGKVRVYPKESLGFLRVKPEPL